MPCHRRSSIFNSTRLVCTKQNSRCGCSRRSSAYRFIDARERRSGSRSSTASCSSGLGRVRSPCAIRQDRRRALATLHRTARPRPIALPSLLSSPARILNALRLAVELWRSQCAPHDACPYARMSRLLAAFDVEHEARQCPGRCARHRRRDLADAPGAELQVERLGVRQGRARRAPGRSRVPARRGRPRAARSTIRRAAVRVRARRPPCHPPRRPRPAAHRGSQVKTRVPLATGRAMPRGSAMTPSRGARSHSVPRHRRACRLEC